MQAKELIDNALDIKGRSQKWLAEQIGAAPQNFNRKLVRNTLSAQELIDVAAALGCRVALLDNSSDKELKSRIAGIGPRVRQAVDGVLYDTAKSDAICHTEPVAGWFMELYRDTNGRFFVAHYTDWQTGSNHLSTCGAEDARRLCEVCGITDNMGNVFFSEE